MKLKAGWLRDINSNWEIVPGNALFSERRAKSTKSDIHLTPSQLYGVLPQNEYLEKTGNRVVLNLVGGDSMKHVETNDFIIHLRSFQGGIEHSRYVGKVSNAYCVLIPNSQVEPRFFRWVLKSTGFIQELSSTTDQLRDGQSIKFEQFRTVGLPLAPIKEQRKIADYLDSELSRLENLQLLIKLQKTKIEELLNSSLNELVSPINPATTKYFKYLVKESNLRADGLHELPLLSVSRHKGIVPRAELMEDEGRADSLEHYKVCEIGDLVINRMSAASGALGLSALRGVVSPDYAVLKPSNLVHPEYLEMIMKSPWFTSEMIMRLRGIGGIGGVASVRTPRVNISDLGDVRVALPTLREQEELALEFSTNRQRTRNLIRILDETLLLIDQLKNSVITGAVTGTLEIGKGRSVA